MSKSIIGQEIKVGCKSTYQLNITEHHSRPAHTFFNCGRKFKHSDHVTTYQTKCSNEEDEQMLEHFRDRASKIRLTLVSVSLACTQHIN